MYISHIYINMVCNFQNNLKTLNIKLQLIKFHNMFNTAKLYHDYNGLNFARNVKLLQHYQRQRSDILTAEWQHASEEYSHNV